MKRHPVDGATERARTLRHAMTDAETKLWRLLRHRQLDGIKFRRQVPIGRHIADFVCHEAKLVIEVDGGQHDHQSENEIHRTHFLKGQGYRILRFWNHDVLANPQGVCAMIAAELRRHHPNPPPSRGRESLTPPNPGLQTPRAKAKEALLLDGGGLGGGDRADGKGGRQ